MKEGYWLDGATGRFFEVDDHARWISDPANAALAGLPAAASARLADLGWQRDRVALLLAAMAAGLIRVRGHGDSITFEFTLPRSQAIAAVGRFLAASDCAGPLTRLQLHDLREGVGTVCAPDDVVLSPGRLEAAFEPVLLRCPPSAVDKGPQGAQHCAVLGEPDPVNQLSPPGRAEERRSCDAVRLRPSRTPSEAFARHT